MNQVYYADWSNCLQTGQELHSTDKETAILNNKIIVIDSSRVFDTKQACCLFILQELRKSAKSIAEAIDTTLHHLETPNETTTTNK